ncbi:Uncharacterised protein [uncultured archaeon]|nr:Uncharacterised protein [uncultured archaeon]
MAGKYGKKILAGNFDCNVMKMKKYVENALTSVGFGNGGFKHAEWAMKDLRIEVTKKPEFLGDLAEAYAMHGNSDGKNTILDALNCTIGICAELGLPKYLADLMGNEHFAGLPAKTKGLVAEGIDAGLRVCSERGGACHIASMNPLVLPEKIKSSLEARMLEAIGNCTTEAGKANLHMLLSTDKYYRCLSPKAIELATRTAEANGIGYRIPQPGDKDRAAVRSSWKPPIGGVRYRM